MKILRMSVLLMSVTFLCGCSFFNKPLLEEFKEYTESLVVEKHSFDGSYPTDEDGIISIPSGADRSITFLMRNPQQYRVEPNLRLGAQTLSAGVETDIPLDDRSIIRQLDSSYVRLTLSSDLLASHDCGVDLNPTLLLYEPNTGRTFGPYWIPLRCNTVPVTVRNLTVLKDISTNTYVLCFNMPDMSGIHRDICTLNVNNRSFDVNSSGVISITGDEFTTEYNSTWCPAIENGSEFAGKDLPRAMYYKSGITLQENDFPFSVSLVDERGLSSSITVSASSEKLESPNVSVSDGVFLDPDENGYAYVELTAPDSSPDAFVCWELFDVRLGTSISQGSEKGSAKLNLSSGKYRIDAWAQKNGYVDSNVTALTNVAVRGSAYYYVSNDGSSDNPGTKDKPFATIQNAVDAIFENEVVEEITYTVNIMSDITDTSTTSYAGDVNNALINIAPPDSSEPLTLHLCGYNNAMVTINAARSSSNTGRVMYIGANALVLLKDITLKGGYLPSGTGGAGVYLDSDSSATLELGGPVILTNDIYLPSGKKIQITGNLAESSNIGITPEVKPTVVSPVVFTEGYADFNSEILPSTYFVSCGTESSYLIGISTDGEAQFMVSGGNVNPNIPNITFISNVSARTITVKAYIDDTEITDDVTEWSFKLYQHGQDTGFSHNSNKFTISNEYPANTYQLSGIATYQGVSVSCMIDISIE